MTEAPIASSGVTSGVTSDDSYPDLLTAIRQHFATITTGARVHLFTTDAPALYPLFLDALPAELRQVYHCSACRRFLERFGAVVRIDHDGKTTSVLWPAQVPEPFVAAIAALSSTVTRASITGVFLYR